MKRKFKLFATVASLCLCLALMAFGVYAATSVTYTATGSVSYIVSDVFADFEVTVYGSGSKGVGRDTAAKIEDTASGISWAKVSTTSQYKKSSYNDTTPNNAGETSTSLNETLSNMDFSAHDAYKIVIKVSNKATSGTITVSSQVGTYTQNKNFVVVAATANDEADIAAGASNDTNFVFYVSLVNPTQSIDKTEEAKDQPFTIQVTATNKSAA